MNLHDLEEISSLSRWMAGREGDPRVAVISGEWGSGQRYLFQRAAEQAVRDGLKAVTAEIDLDGWEADRLNAGVYLGYQAVKRAAKDRGRPADAEEVPGLDRALALGAAAGSADGRFLEAHSLADVADGLAEDETLVVHALDSSSLPGIARKRLLALAERPNVRLALSAKPLDGTMKVTRGTEAIRFEVMPLDAGDIRVRLHCSEEEAERLERLCHGSRGALAARFSDDEPRPLLAQALDAAPEDKRKHLETFAHLAALCGENVPVRRLLGFLGIDVGDHDDWLDLIDETLGADSPLSLFAERFQHPSFPNEQVYGFHNTADTIVLSEELPQDSRARLATDLIRSFAQSLPMTTRAAVRLYAHLCRHAGADRDRQELERELAWWVGPGDTEAMQSLLGDELVEGVRQFQQVWMTVNTAQFRWPSYRTLAVLDATARTQRPGELASAIEALRCGFLIDMGRYADGEAAARKGLESSDDKLLASALEERLGAALREQGRKEDAEGAFERCHRLRMELLEEGDQRVKPVLQQFIQALRRAGKEDEAREVEQKLEAKK